MDGTLIFLHIRKTAGSTLHALLTRHYAPERIYHVEASRWKTAVDDFATLPREERESYDLVRGHMRYGMHEHVRSPAGYVTVLRDPVDRVVSSHFHLLREARNNPVHVRIVEEGIPLEQVLEDELRIGCDNWQTRVLADRLDAPYGSLGEADLEMAKHRLDGFRFVGLTERMPESMFLLGRELGWRRVGHVAPRNVGRNRSRGPDLDPEARRLVREHNALDQELYAYTTRLLEKRLASLTDRERRGLSRYVLADAVYRPVGARLRRLRRWLRGAARKVLSS